MDSKPDTCHKTRYANETEANKDVERIKKTSTRSNVPIRSYFCHVCSNWHLTSKESYVVTTLKAVSKELQQAKTEIKRLAAENKRLQDRNLQDTQKYIRRDDEVIALHQTLLKKNKMIKGLMNDNSDLITKNIVLRKNHKNSENQQHKG